MRTTYVGKDGKEKTLDFDFNDPRQLYLVLEELGGKQLSYDFQAEFEKFKDCAIDQQKEELQEYVNDLTYTNNSIIEELKLAKQIVAQLSYRSEASLEKKMNLIKKLNNAIEATIMSKYAVEGIEEYVVNQSNYP